MSSNRHRLKKEVLQKNGQPPKNPIDWGAVITRVLGWLIIFGLLWAILPERNPYLIFLLVLSLDWLLGGS